MNEATFKMYSKWRQGGDTLLTVMNRSDRFSVAHWKIDPLVHAWAYYIASVPVSRSESSLAMNLRTAKVLSHCRIIDNDCCSLKRHFLEASFMVRVALVSVVFMFRKYFWISCYLWKM